MDINLRDIRVKSLSSDVDHILIGWDGGLAVYDLRSRGFLLKISANCNFTWGLDSADFDLTRGLIFAPAQNDGFQCINVKTGDVLWRKKKNMPLNALFNPRNHRLLLGPYYDYVDPITGRLDKINKTPKDCWYADLHPTLPITFFQRGEPVRSGKDIIAFASCIEFVNEVTGEVASSESAVWLPSRSIFRSFFHEQKFFLTDYENNLHCVDVCTAKHLWSLKFKKREPFPVDGGGYHVGLKCLVLRANCGTHLVCPESGKMIDFVKNPPWWTAAMHHCCFIDGYSKLVTSCGKIFNSLTFERIEENVFDLGACNNS